MKLSQNIVVLVPILIDQKRLEFARGSLRPGPTVLVLSSIQLFVLFILILIEHVTLFLIFRKLDYQSVDRISILMLCLKFITTIPVYVEVGL